MWASDVICALEFLFGSYLNYKKVYIITEKHLLQWTTLMQKIPLGSHTG